MHRHQRSAREFAAVARRFCDLVDAHGASSPEELLRTLNLLLPELLFRASVLPELEPETDTPLQDSMGYSRWRSLFESLTSFLGDFGPYWVLFDPVTPADDEPLRGSLADDLADIYRDLMRGLAVVQDDESIPVEAIWSWQFNYTIHWGQHALDASRTIHSLLYQHGLAEDA